MMKFHFLFIAVLFTATCFSQNGYNDSLVAYQKKYVQQHGVVKELDKQQLSFFKVNAAYRVTADFTPATSGNWIRFKTSGKLEKVYRVFGTATFYLNGKTCQLHIYQSQDLLTNPQYKNYLFLPFTDSTTGVESYIGGRYIDLNTNDVVNKKIVLDFNKAYNPYCAYVSGVYNCPVPPKENALPIAIKAGEKAFMAAH